jgi:hypothetical protein
MRIRLAGIGLLFAASAAAGPWAEPGDAALRTDIELLAGAGVVDNITTHWPVPWAGLLDRLDTASLEGAPDYVRAAARRLRARGAEETRTGVLKMAVTVDAASTPSMVRGFDGLGRQTLEGKFIVDYLWSGTALHLARGARSTTNGDRQIPDPDGSYIAQRIGDAVVYAGYLDHWWGPGWISALSASTNARPIPQVGFARVSTTPFETPLLSWLGPYQIEFFVGQLGGKRVAKNTIYNGLRFVFSPIPHLEIGLARIDEMCGSGHPCKPLTGYFNLSNDPKHTNIVNDQGNIDIRYSRSFAHWGFEVYTQAMNEDTNPISHSSTSHQFGGSLFLPFRSGMGRFTVEYTDSVATQNLFGSTVQHGIAYNNYSYVDGMRYRGRTLGFSLDSDSRLFSVQGAFTDDAARSFTLTYHHAQVSTPANLLGNAVTAAPVTVNMGVARVSLPLDFTGRHWRIDLEGRLQDDRPRPDRGFQASIEAALSVNL